LRIYSGRLLSFDIYEMSELRMIYAIIYTIQRVERLIADDVELIHICMNMTCEEYVDIIHVVKR